MGLKVNFRESKMCWYCRNGSHVACTKRFPASTEEYECICWKWAGRKRHYKETTNEDDAIINILGSMGNG